MNPTIIHSHNIALGRSFAFVGGGIGDVVMHTAHFQAIARASSSGKVTIGCRTAAPILDLMQGNDFVDDVIGFGDGADKNRVIIKTAVQKLKARNFDSFFCLKSNPRLIMAAYFAGIRNRYGYMRVLDPRATLLTHRTVPQRTKTHPLHMAKADHMLNQLGIKFDHAAARLYPRVELDSAALRILGRKPAIALGVNVSDPRRQWGQRFIPLTRALANQTNANFVLFGASDVSHIARSIIEQSGLDEERFINLTTMGCSLSLSHAILARCALYVGNDSSGTNLAVMSGIPAVIFCALDLVLSYSSLIVPIRPEPKGSGVAGISVEKALVTTMETIRLCAPSIVKCQGQT